MAVTPQKPAHIAGQRPDIGALAALGFEGRGLGIVGDEPAMTATLMTRTGEATWTTTTPWDTVAPRLLNFVAPSRFKF